MLVGRALAIAGPMGVVLVLGYDELRGGHPMREKVRELLDEQNSVAGKIVGYFVLALIVSSCAAVVIETEPGLPDWAREWLRRFEFFCAVAFSIEYVLRLWSSRSPGKKAVEPLMIIDLLAVLPFYVALFPGAFDLRFLRILRSLRILRVLKLHRYSNALSMLIEVMREARHQLVSFLFVTSLFLFLVASFIYHIEPGRFGSISHAAWWAVVTLTTVGYGDVIPGSTAGRAASSIFMLLGIGIIAIPTGIISSGLTEHYRKKKSKVCSECGLASHDLDAMYCKRCSTGLSEGTGRYSVAGTGDEEEDEADK